MEAMRTVRTMESEIERELKMLGKEDRTAKMRQPKSSWMLGGQSRGGANETFPVRLLTQQRFSRYKYFSVAASSKLGRTPVRCSQPSQESHLKWGRLEPQPSAFRHVSSTASKELNEGLIPLNGGADTNTIS